jgi:CSLREA domain-containing protein
MIISSAFFVKPVAAATIGVNTTADVVADDGLCSLREAITAANTDTAVTGCSAGSGADVIQIPAGTYTTSSYLPQVESEITLAGENVSTTIIQASTCNPVAEGNSCTHEYGILVVSTGGKLSIDQLTLQHARKPYSDGGAIYNASGNVTITNSAIIKNYSSSGGGIRNGFGTLSVSYSTISNNLAANWGGGIGNEATLNVTFSTLDGNTSHLSGGGIYNVGSVIITNSTLSNNQSDANGGGLYQDGTNAIVINSTFSSNYAAGNGGGVYNASFLKLTNCTFFGNNTTDPTGSDVKGGALMSYYADELRLYNTLLANSYPYDIASINLSSASYSGNVCENCGSGVGVKVPGLSAYIGSLADNGGATLTHALLADAPAIDAANDYICKETYGPFDEYPDVGAKGRDQRDMFRVGTCDTGAYEYGAAMFITYLPLTVH